MKTTIAALVVLLVALTSCTSKSKAKLQAQSAYLAGQQQAFARMREPHGTNILVLGNVRNREVPWTDGLTLAQALIAADYLPPGDPTEIVITRQGQPIRVNPADLLRGNDWPLQPGDTIELRP